jgi:Carboxypeptidase regulatory-like domain
LKTILAGSALLLGAAAALAAQARLEGVVRDAGRSPASGARVAWGGHPAAQTVTDAAGRFALALGGPGEYVLSVEAAAFVRAKRRLFARGEDIRLEIVLVRAAFSETVAVTAARAPVRLRDTPASVVNNPG